MTHQELQRMVNQISDYQINQIAQTVMRCLPLYGFSYASKAAVFMEAAMAASDPLEALIEADD